VFPTGMHPRIPGFRSLMSLCSRCLVLRCTLHHCCSRFGAPIFCFAVGHYFPVLALFPSSQRVSTLLRETTSTLASLLAAAAAARVPLRMVAVRLAALPSKAPKLTDAWKERKERGRLQRQLVREEKVAPS